MSLPRKNVIALLALLGVPLVGLFFFKLPERISTDLLDLAPAASLDNAEAQAMRAANQVIARQVFVGMEGFADAEERTQAASWLDDFTAGNAVFSHVYVPGRAQLPGDLLAVLQREKLALLLPGWLERRRAEFAKDAPDEPFVEWLAQSQARVLDRFLESPYAAQYADGVTQDPLLLLPDAAQVMKESGTALQAEATDDSTLLAWLGLTLNPLDTDDQARITEAVATLETQLAEAFPNCAVTTAGVYAVAQESSSAAAGEVMRLNIMTALAVLVLLGLFLRRWRSLLILLLPVSAALLWALFAGLLFFERIHVFALGMSSVLLGLAVDYGIHAEMHRLTESGAGTLWAKVRKPLLAGCLSTCLGFLVLLEAPILALRQVGVLVPAGLLGALVMVYLLYRALGPVAQKPPRALSLRLPDIPRWVTFGFFGVTGLLALFVVVTHFARQDGINDYQLAGGPAKQRFTAMLEKLQIKDVGPRWVLFAEDPAELLEALQKLPTGTFPFADVIQPGREPGLTPGERQAFAQAFARALEEEGFDAASFAGFLDELDETPAPDAFPQALQALSQALPGPLGLTLGYEDGLFFAVVSAPESVVNEAGVPVVRLAEQARLDSLLARASDTLMRQCLWGWLVIVVILLVVFGLRDGLVAGLLPAWAGLCGVAWQLALLGSLSLMGWIGLILAYCLALDYSAFASVEKERPLASVRLSALTTVAAFGILGSSAIPALQTLGLAVASAIVTAVVGVELFQARRETACPRA